MRVGFYARVSSDEQRERSTIDAQVEYAERTAARDDWTLTIFRDDGVSGVLPLTRRPGGAQMLEAVKAGQLDLVCTYKLDRLGRTLQVLLTAIQTLSDLAVPYRSLTEPFDLSVPMGRAFFQMLAVFAELERETLLSRTRSGIERLAAKDGRWLGGVVPYGYSTGSAGTLPISY